MPNTQGLPVGPALDFGWNTFKVNPRFLAGVYFAAALMTWFVTWADEFTSDRLDFALWLALVFVTLVVGIGLVKITLRFEAGEATEFANLFDGIARVPAMFVASLVTGAACLAGFILLVVPGVIVGLRLMFVGYIVVDRRSGPIDAVRESWAMTRGYTLDLFLFAVALFGINLLGLILFGVGIFATMPVTGLATARIYRTLGAARTVTAPAAGPGA